MARTWVALPFGCAKRKTKSRPNKCCSSDTREQFSVKACNLQNHLKHALRGVSPSPQELGEPLAPEAQAELGAAGVAGGVRGWYSGFLLFQFKVKQGTYQKNLPTIGKKESSAIVLVAPCLALLTNALKTQWNHFAYSCL